MDEEYRDAAARHPSAAGGGPAARDRNPADRGSIPALGVDLPLLRKHGEFVPVVEYLTAIQSMRGEDGSSLMFVRGDDIDAMAERNGSPVHDFIDRLDQLGVVVSNN